MVIDIENKSYIDENTGEMVLRCKKYPKKGSKEWVVSGDFIEFCVVGKEGKNRTFLISDMTKAYLKIHPVIGTGHLTFTFKVDGSMVIIPVLTFQISNASDVAQEIYDYIAEKNPNIPPLVPSVPIEPGSMQSRIDETTGESIVCLGDNKRYAHTQAPGRTLLRIIGIVYIALGIFMVVGLLNASAAMETVPIMVLLHTGLHIFIGIFAVIKCNDLTKTDRMQSLAIFNFFLIITWRREHILLVVIIAALSILFYVGAAKNGKAYQRLLQQGIRVEKPKGRPKDPMSAKPLGKTLLRIAGALLIIFAVIAIGYALPPSGIK